MKQNKFEKSKAYSVHVLSLFIHYPHSTLIGMQLKEIELSNCKPDEWHWHTTSITHQALYIDFWCLYTTS